MQILNNFDDVQDKKLQAYNRLIVSLNLSREGAREQSLNYLKQFDNDERVAIAAMAIDIQNRGRKEVTKELQDNIQGDYSEVEVFA